MCVLFCTAIFLLSNGKMRFYFDRLSYVSVCNCSLWWIGHVLNRDNYDCCIRIHACTHSVAFLLLQIIVINAIFRQMEYNFRPAVSDRINNNLVYTFLVGFSRFSLALLTWLLVIRCENSTMNCANLPSKFREVHTPYPRSPTFIVDRIDFHQYIDMLMCLTMCDGIYFFFFFWIVLVCYFAPYMPFILTRRKIQLFLLKFKYAEQNHFNLFHTDTPKNLNSLQRIESNR